MRKCKFCNKSIEGSHHNRKYCSDSCYEKNRYKEQGQRTTPEQRKAWYQNRVKNPKYRKKLQDQTNLRAKKVRAFLKEYKLKLGCKDCGYKDHHVALEFDHISGTKELNVCHAKSIKQAKEEIKKCEVVCSNCHRVRHYNRDRK